MSTRNVVIKVEPDLAEAFNRAPKQEQERIKTAMRNLLKLVPPQQEKASRLSKKETELFLRINRTLTPEKQERYDELTEKRLDETLTRSEHAELGRLVKEIEQIWADRLQAVIELAKLWKVSPQEMMKRLEIDPSASV